MPQHRLRPLVFLLLLTIPCAMTAGAQPPPADRGPGPNPGWDGDAGQPPPMPPMEPNRPPMERTFRTGSPGRWWTDPELVQRLGLTADQQKRIDALFQQYRLKLIDLSASLQKQEAGLEPLLDADPPDESKILMQIDRIAQARADLEKTNARMLLGFRNVLSLDQWKKLQSSGPPRPRRGEPR